MKLIKTMTAVLCAVSLSLSAMTVPLVHAEDTVLPSGLTLGEFQQTLEEQEKELEGKFSSAEVGIFQGDEVLYTGYFREINLTEHIPADENSVYEWGSISKTFVWVSVLQLLEQGKLDLEEDIRHYLPERFLQHLSYDDPITMRNLMNHNAGWCENTYSIEGYPAGAATGTLADLMTYGQAFVDPDAPLFQNPETQEMLFAGSDFYGDSDIPVCCHGLNTASVSMDTAVRHTHVMQI